MAKVGSILTAPEGQVWDPEVEVRLVFTPPPASEAVRPVLLIIGPPPSHAAVLLAPGLADSAAVNGHLIHRKVVVTGMGLSILEMYVVARPPRPPMDRSLRCHRLLPWS